MYMSNKTTSKVIFVCNLRIKGEKTYKISLYGMDHTTASPDFAFFRLSVV